MKWEMGNRKWEIGNGKGNIYRTSPEHPTSIDRKFMEHPLKLCQRYIEDGKCIDNPRNIYENLSNIERKSMKIYDNL